VIIGSQAAAARIALRRISTTKPPKKGRSPRQGRSPGEERAICAGAR